MKHCKFCKRVSLLHKKNHNSWPKLIDSIHAKSDLLLCKMNEKTHNK